MVCLRRLCKRYRCWKTLTENGGVRTGGMEAMGKNRPSPARWLEAGDGPSAEGPDQLLWGLQAGTRRRASWAISLEVIQNKTLCVSETSPFSKGKEVLTLWKGRGLSVAPDSDKK